MSVICDRNFFLRHFMSIYSYLIRRWIKWSIASLCIKASSEKRKAWIAVRTYKVHICVHQQVTLALLILLVTQIIQTCRLKAFNLLLSLFSVSVWNGGYPYNLLSLCIKHIFFYFLCEVFSKDAVYYTRFICYQLGFLHKRTKTNISVRKFYAEKADSHLFSVYRYLYVIWAVKQSQHWFSSLLLWLLICT